MRSIKRTTVIALMTVMLTGISMLEGCPTMNVQAQENSNNIVENFNENNNAVAVLTNSENGDKYLVTKVNGNWKCYDSSVKISDREVTYACGHKYVRIKKPTSNTFSYSTGFTKYTKVNYFDRAGSNSHCYLKRGTRKKWELEVLANITT